MTPQYRPPRLLGADTVVDEFECRSDEQTDWLRHHARQAHAAGTAKVLVVTPDDGDLVVAYYAWSMARILIEDAPARVARVLDGTHSPLRCLPGSECPWITRDKAWAPVCWPMPSAGPHSWKSRSDAEAY